MKMKAKGFLRSLLLLTALALMLSVTPSLTSAAPSVLFEEGALTPKPPAPAKSNNGIGLNAVFEYLFVMENKIEDNENGTVTMTGYTLTKKTAQTVEVALRLERWTGTQWVSASNTYVYVASNGDYAYGGTVLSVSKGYYYRIVSTHKAKDGSVTETYVMEGPSRLIPL